MSTRLHPCRGAEADPHGSVCPQTIEISQLQPIDKVVFVHVVQVVQVSPVQVVEKTGGIVEKILEIPASSWTRLLHTRWRATRGAWVVDISVVAQMQFPMVLTVQKNIEILQLQSIEKVVDVTVGQIQQIPRVLSV